MGNRPRRSGRAKVLCPSPPYVVPIRLNSVSYSEIGSSWPSQNIHPAGAKLPANIRISPTYGCAISALLGRRREDALKGDAEGQHEERLHVDMRLAPSDVADGRRQQRRQPG